MSVAPLNCLLITIGSAGDVHPFVGLGQSLVRRGHRVTLATGTHFEPLIRRAGLEFEPLFDSDHYRRMLDDPNLWHRYRGAKFVMQNAILPLLRPAYEIVRARYEAGRTVVAASSMALGALVAREKLGVPTATVHLQPVMIRSALRPPELAGMCTAEWLPRWMIAAQYWLADRLVVDRIFERDWNGFRREVGLAPVRRVFQNYIHSPDLAIGMFPEWYAPPQSDWPRQVRLTGFPLYDERDVSPIDSELERFLADGEPPIAFTAGSAMTHGQNFFAAAAQGCAQFGRRGLLLTRFPQQLPNSLPNGVRHVEFAPFSQLLPRCAAVVHHGGIGSTAQSIAAGIPQLVMPMSHDQFDNARRVVQLGVGTAMSRREFESGRGVAVLDKMITTAQYGEACRRYAALLGRETALDDAATLLERLIAER